MRQAGGNVRSLDPMRRRLDERRERPPVEARREERVNPMPAEAMRRERPVDRQACTAGFLPCGRARGRGAAFRRTPLDEPRLRRPGRDGKLGARGGPVNTSKPSSVRSRSGRIRLFASDRSRGSRRITFGASRQTRDASARAWRLLPASLCGLAERGLRLGLRGCGRCGFALSAQAAHEPPRPLRELVHVEVEHRRDEQRQQL